MYAEYNTTCSKEKEKYTDTYPCVGNKGGTSLKGEANAGWIVIHLLRHLPCVEEVDPGLALLDLEQRAVVGGQPRLELLNHLDLEERTNGTNIYRLAAMLCMQRGNAGRGGYKRERERERCCCGRGTVQLGRWEFDRLM